MQFPVCEEGTCYSQARCRGQQSKGHGDTHAPFFPTGLGHMLGLDVHDMEGLGEDYARILGPHIPKSISEVEKTSSSKA